MSRVRCSALSLCSALIGLWLGGCGTPSSKQKGETNPTPPIVNLHAEVAGLKFSITNLIILNGPGSWRDQAYWDEYVVTLSNQGHDVLTVEGAWLGDVLDRQVFPGDNLERLEEKGKAHADHLGVRGAPILAGHFTPYPNTLEIAAQAAEPGKLARAATVLAVGAIAFVVLSPVLGGGFPLSGSPRLPGDVARAQRQKAKILAEFDQRRLSLPVTLAPGETFTGSLFFPLTPGPEYMTLQIATSGEKHELRMELPGWQGLHFSYVPDKTALQAARPPKRIYAPRVPAAAPP